MANYTNISQQKDISSLSFGPSWIKKRSVSEVQPSTSSSSDRDGVYRDGSHDGYGVSGVRGVSGMSSTRNSGDRRDKRVRLAEGEDTVDMQHHVYDYNDDTNDTTTNRNMHGVHGIDGIDDSYARDRDRSRDGVAQLQMRKDKSLFSPRRYSPTTLPDSGQKTTPGSGDRPYKLSKAKSGSMKAAMQKV